MQPNRAFGRRHKFNEVMQGGGRGDVSLALSDYVSLTPKLCALDAPSSANYDSFCAADSTRNLNATTAAIVSPYMYMKNRHYRAQFLSARDAGDRCSCGSKKTGTRSCATDDEDEDLVDEVDLRRVNVDRRPCVPLLDLSHPM
ncbi:unnamed protein product, partial [Soboliphyme baturini]|uniref:Uncharacterized protein n=1 Tax=Soboliphyme baturini TaxID=241478 RepID=A0A183IAH3_9BILA